MIGDGVHKTPLTDFLKDSLQTLGGLWWVARSSANFLRSLYGLTVRCFERDSTMILLELSIDAFPQSQGLL